MRPVFIATLCSLLACGVTAELVPERGPEPIQVPEVPSGYSVNHITTFDAPWAMVFVPDGRLLVTERSAATNAPGRLTLVRPGGATDAVLTAELPPNIGLLDVLLHPDFAANQRIYFTFMEPGGADEPRVGRAKDIGTLAPAGLAVAYGTLKLTGVPKLENVRVIWRQVPKIVSHPGSGEPGGRLAFSPEDGTLFVTAGSRQEFEGQQTLENTLGKTIRLNADGTVPATNPFVGVHGALPEIWALGQRNQYGLAFDASGQLWEHEMGPLGGDELNLISKGANYGWPLVSHGSTYGGMKYPEPAPNDGFTDAAVWWTPVIAAAGLVFYSGDLFTSWKGDALIGGLKSEGLVRVHFATTPTGVTATEVERLNLGARIREVEEANDGSIWVLEDAPTGRLLRMTPRE